MVAVSDLLEFDACRLAEAYRVRRVSPVEVLQAVLNAAESTRATVNAFAVLDHEVSLAAARQSEQRWRSGAPLSVLDGIPISIKDNIYVQGMPTRFGSVAIPAAMTSGPDSPVVARLREAGAVIFGKTGMPDFAHKMVTDSPLTGITRNPLNLAVSPGGSSGGASAAVSAGLGPIAIGTDGAGSIRIPASWTGTYGLKPSLGRVPHHPRGAFGSYSHVGPITRNVADAARVMATLTRPDSRDWFALPYLPVDYERALNSGVRGARIAFSPRLGIRSLQVDSQIALAVERAAKAFQSLGAIVESRDPPCIDDCSEVANAHFAMCSARLVRQLGDKSTLLDPSLRRIAATGESLDRDAIVESMIRRSDLGTTLNAFFDDFDFLLAPVVPFSAPVLADIDPNVVLEPVMTQWCNVVGLPAASVPCGVTREGLPIGLQIVGRRWADAAVLAASHAFEQASL